MSCTIKVIMLYLFENIIYYQTEGEKTYMGLT